MAWRAWVAPQRLLIQSRQAKLSSSIEEIARLRLSTTALPALQREVKALEATLAAPPPKSEPAQSGQHVLDALHDLASRSQLEVTTFTAARGQAAANPQGRRVQLGLEGRFQDLVRFLERVVAAGSVASVTDVTVKPHAKPDGRRSIAATLTLEPGSGDAAILPAESDHEVDLPDERDPFLTVVAGADGAGAASGSARANLPPGLAGVSIHDVTVTGIVRSGDETTAILQGPDRRTFVARRSDRLLDGVIEQIDSAGVVFVTPSRRRRGSQSTEIRKTLARPPGDVR